MAPTERDACAAIGVRNIVEIQIGYDSLDCQAANKGILELCHRNASAPDLLPSITYRVML
jgi:hypothetical protein